MIPSEDSVLPVRRKVSSFTRARGGLTPGAPLHVCPHTPQMLADGWGALVPEANRTHKELSMQVFARRVSLKTLPQQEDPTLAGRTGPRAPAAEP